MKRNYLLMGILLILLGPSASAELDQVLFDQGKGIFERNCMACHSYGPPPKAAPPMIGISGHYHQAFSDRDQAIAHMVDFIKQPTPEKSMLMPMAQQAWGMMPPLTLPDEHLKAVGYWIWEIYNLEAGPGSGRMMMKQKPMRQQPAQ
jgi:cytochrome c